MINQKKAAEKEIFCKDCDCKNCDGCMSGSNWNFNSDSETYENDKKYLSESE